jgi:lysophospholipase L1-like esterase
MAARNIARAIATCAALRDDARMRGEAASRAALVAMSVAIALGVAEIAARLLTTDPPIVFRNSITPSDDPALRYALRPGAPDGAATISSAGLRDREYDRPKPGGVWRIVVIGDSITYGSGGPAANAYPQRLEALLGAAHTSGGPRIEVLNLGVPGYDLVQIVERLRTVGLAFEPDAIVYGYSLNDPQEFSVEAEALARLRTGIEDQVAGNWLDALLAHSRLYRLARRRAAERASLAALRADMPDDPIYAAAKSGDPAQYIRAIHTEGESARRLERGFDALAAIAAEHRLPLLVAIFPLFEPQGGDSLADVHARVASLARQRGFSVLDLGPVYAAAVPVFGSPLRADFLHPDAVGHRVAAVALFTWMCRHAWLPADAVDCAIAPSGEPDAAIVRAIAGALP